MRDRPTNAHVPIHWDPNTNLEQECWGLNDPRIFRSTCGRVRLDPNQEIQHVGEKGHYRGPEDGPTIVPTTTPLLVPVYDCLVATCARAMISQTMTTNEASLKIVATTRAPV